MSPTQTGKSERQRLLVGFGLWFAAIVVIGLPRALGRHLHVDETHVTYESALLAIHRLPAFVSGTTPSLALLGWVIARADASVAMFALGRTMFFALFVGKLIGCSWAQPYFASARGRLLVLVAATLFVPLWLNGFEIRMDVIVSAGSVVLYGLAQRAASARSLSLRAVFGAGICAACMQCNSFKAFAYWLPFSLIVLAIAASRAADLRQRLRIVGSFFGGLVIGAGANLAVLALAGQLGVYAHGIAGLGGLIAATQRFTPTGELVRLVGVSPLAFALAAAQPVLFGIALAKRKAISMPSLITLLFLAWSFAALYLNPVPYPYNFIHVLPFVFFAALDTAARALEASDRLRRPILVALSVVTLGLFVRGWLFEPFLTRTNDAQISYIRAAEALTGPDDTVLDGVGLVLTRKPPHKDWLVHSLRMARYRDGQLTRFATMMREHPSPVIVDNYRWGWLSPEDLSTRRERYVAIAPRLFVLGARLPESEGDLPIHYPGSYQVVSVPGVAVSIDGKPVANSGAVELAVGVHRYERSGEGTAGIRWIGPNAASATEAITRISSLGRGEPFFTNEPAELAR